MSYLSIKTFMGAHLATNWTSTDYQLLAENNPPPNDRTRTWIRFSIRPTDSGDMEIGGVRRRTEGLLWFQIFVPENRGTTDAFKVGDLLCGILNNKAFTTSDGFLRTRSIGLQFIGPETTGYQLWRCTVPFTHEDNQPI